MGKDIAILAQIEGVHRAEARGFSFQGRNRNNHEAILGLSEILMSQGKRTAPKEQTERIFSNKK